jgi:hypothetical protein
MALRGAVEQLRKHLLPKAFDPLGNYKDFARIQSRTRSFLVLSHAEIETYLEQSAKDIAKASETLWKSKERIARPLAHLLVAIGGKMQAPDKIHSTDGDPPKRFDTFLTELFQTYYRRINENHGVKEQNVSQLFVPLGVPQEAFAATLLPGLDSLGNLRGDHAHHSSKSVRNLLDPETEYKKITEVIADLGKFDEWVVAYRKSIR